MTKKCVRFKVGGTYTAKRRYEGWRGLKKGVRYRLESVDRCDSGRCDANGLCREHARFVDKATGEPVSGECWYNGEECLVELSCQKEEIFTFKVNKSEEKADGS